MLSRVKSNERRLAHTCTTLKQKVEALFGHVCQTHRQRWKCHCQWQSSPVTAHACQHTQHRQQFLPTVTIMLYAL